MAPERLEKVTITNFNAKIQKERHGDVNSGNQPFSSSPSGVYPFGNFTNSSLSFLEDKSSIGSTTITGPIVYMSNGVNPSNLVDPASFCVDLNGTVYMVNVSDTSTPTADTDTLVKFTNQPVGQTLYYGGGFKLFNNVMYIGSDGTVSYSSSLIPGTATFTNMGGSSLTASRPRPLEVFLNNLYIGNGNNIAESTNGTSITTLNKLSPALPSDYTIRDLKISNDGRYLVILANTSINSLNILSITGATNTIGNRKQFGGIDSVVILWNGTDAGATSYQYYKGTVLSSIIVSNTETVLFGKDAESVGLWDLSGNKVAEITEGQGSSFAFPPDPGSSFAVGKKIFFQIQVGTANSLYCLDREDNALYCLYATTILNEFIKGSVCVPTFESSSISGGINTDMTRAKIYFSFASIPTSTQGNNLLYSQHLRDYGGTPYSGVYATQVQKFSKKVSPREVWVYTTGTSSGVSFSVSLIGDNGSSISNSSNTYTFSAGTDKTRGQGSLDLIKFPLRIQNVEAFGVKITNGGTTNVVIDKIEVYYEQVIEPKNLA